MLAVFDGTLSSACDSKHVGGAHVDLLPECNFLRLRSACHRQSALYLHLAPGSLCLPVGSAVKRGQQLAAAGNTGFSTGAHLHLQLNTVLGAAAAGEEEEEEAQQTVLWGLEDPVLRAVLPVAGHSYSSEGWQPPLQALRAAPPERPGLRSRPLCHRAHCTRHPAWSLPLPAG